MGFFSRLFGKKKRTEKLASEPETTLEVAENASEEKTEAEAQPQKVSVATEAEKPAELEATEKEEIKVNASSSYTGKFEINVAKDGKYFFNLYASNSVCIATSQMYSTAQSAKTGIASVIANAAKAPIEDQTLSKHEPLGYPKWEIYLDSADKYRFRLNASNGNCVCHSQGYTAKSSCKNGIDSIIKSCSNAEIVKAYLKK